MKTWIDLLARNNYLFQVPPWHRRLDRALKKEAKVYLWDWSEIAAEGVRFENLVASHLLKFCHFWHDAHGVGAELYYVRDVEKREVDFLVVWNRNPWMLVECKLSGEGDTRAPYTGGPVPPGPPRLIRPPRACGTRKGRPLEAVPSHILESRSSGTFVTPSACWRWTRTS